MFFAWLLLQAKILTIDNLIQRNCPCNMLVFINAHREIRKRTDNDVTFNKEYSKVSIFTGNAK
jgi:hypothetical protein